MSYSQYFLPNLMDMGSLLGTILGAILNYKRGPMSTLNGPLVKQILTVAHMGFPKMRDTFFYLFGGPYDQDYNIYP